MILVLFVDVCTQSYQYSVMYCIRDIIDMQLLHSPVMACIAILY